MMLRRAGGKRERMVMVYYGFSLSRRPAQVPAPHYSRTSGGVTGGAEIHCGPWCSYTLSCPNVAV